MVGNAGVRASGRRAAGQDRPGHAWRPVTSTIPDDAAPAVVALHAPTGNGFLSVRPRRTTPAQIELALYEQRSCCGLGMAGRSWCRPTVAPGDPAACTVDIARKQRARRYTSR